MASGFQVRLNRKFADFLDGIDLTKATAGEVIELPAQEAMMLIAEGWAEPVSPPNNDIATADDRPPRRRRSAKL